MRMISSVSLPILVIIATLISATAPAQEESEDRGLVAAQIVQQIRDIAKTHFAAGRRNKAIELLSEAAGEHPSSADLWFDLGVVLLVDRNYDAARDAFQKTIALNPSHADAYLNLGVLALHTKDLDRAEEMFTKALALKPDWVHARLNLAGLHVKRGKIPEALQGYKAVLAANPGCTVARFNIAQCYLENGDWNSAAEAYREIVQQDPGAFRAHLELASLYRTRLNKPEIALYHYYKVVETVKTGPVAESARKAIEQIGKN